MTITCAARECHRTTRDYYAASLLFSLRSHASLPPG